MDRLDFDFSKIFILVLISLFSSLDFCLLLFSPVLSGDIFIKINKKLLKYS